MGPKLGEDMKKVMAASKKGDWRLLDDGRAEVGGVTLDEDEFAMRLQPKEGVASQALSSNDAVLVLDTEVTPELEQEGLARDLVRLVQQARKEAGLHVADRIELRIAATGDVLAALEKFRGYIAEQTLATSIEFGEPDGDMHRGEGKLGGVTVVFGLRKA